jgi:hypothetical protein
MRLPQTLVILALGSAFAFIGASVPGALAQSANPGPAGALTSPNNDAGSGGSHAPGSKISGPDQPANPAPGNGSANNSTTVPPTAGSANPGTFSNAAGPLTAKPGHPENHGANGAANTTPGQ